MSPCATLDENISELNEVLQFQSVTGIRSFGSIRGLTSLSGEISRRAARVGYRNAFWLYAAVCVAALPLVRIKRESEGI